MPSFSALRAAACVALLVSGSAAHAQSAPAPTNAVTVLRTGASEPSSDAHGGGGYPLALGGNGAQRVLAVASDAAGNAYVTGSFSGTIDFDPGPGQAVGTSVGGDDFFAASYDPAGTLRWAFSYGSDQSEFGTGVAVADGRVFLGANFNGAINFGAAGTVTSVGSLDGLVLAVDAATGAFVWASAFGGALADGNPKLATAGGRVFVDARFIGPADFDDGPGQTILNGVDSYDAALASFSAATGALQWARVIFGGAGQQFEGGVYATATTVYATASSFGNRNGLVGAYSAATGAPAFETPTPNVTPTDVVFDGTRLVAVGAAVPDATTTNVWTAAFSTSGTQGWTNTLTGPGRDVAQGVALIGGRVVVGGEFEQTVDFDPGAGSAPRTSAGGSDGFVALYAAATGAFVQAEALGGPGADQAYSVDGGASRGLVAGSFSDTADLAPTPGETDTRTALDPPDAFVAVYFPDGRAAQFTVTTAADAGPGSFRQALLDAGANGGGAIAFAIPGAGPHEIALTSLLAPVAAPVVVDGFTQPGASPNTAGPWEPTNAAIDIVLSGSGVAAAGSGLVLQGGASTVRGLAVGGFQQHGIVLNGQVGNVVEGCYIGTDASGTQARRNGFSAVFVAQSGQARIGGGAAAARNVLSGNGSYGVIVYGAGASGTVVQGNYIGTNAAGTAALTNGSSGIVTGSTVVFNDPSPSEALDVRIGGAAPGEGNLISGNTAFGVEIYGFAPTGAATSLGDTRLEGNRIGTNAAGVAAVPNTLAGVLVRRNPTGVTIGGAAAGAGNVVSGGADDGIIVEISDGVVVENNLVGTDATGTLPLGNAQSGILLFCSRNAIVRGNVAAANGTGTGANVGGGIGGTCTNPNFQGSGNRIVGNVIGTDRSGTAQMGNGLGGVVFSQRQGTETIGGDAPGEANTIAYNIGPAVIVRSTILGPVRIGRNAMYANGAPGIDLEPLGRAANDAGDADTGANRQQNYPVLTAVSGDGAATLTVTYSVDTAAANATYPLTVDFYRADAAGVEGQTWVGRATYATPQAPATASFNPAVVIADGDRFVATATDAAGNTSEFSDAVSGSGAVAGEDVPGAEAFSLAVGPNPARGASMVTLRLGAAQDARLEALDVLGRRVALLHDGPLGAGPHTFHVDAARLAPGVYVVRARAGDTVVTQRLTVVR